MHAADDNKLSFDDETVSESGIFYQNKEHAASFTPLFPFFFGRTETSASGS